MSGRKRIKFNNVLFKKASSNLAWKTSFDSHNCTSCVRLQHAGPNLHTASLCHHYHIVGCRRVVHSITRGYITCRHVSARPTSQILGQLPSPSLSPVFDKTGLDYAGPIYIKQGHVRKFTMVKAYICIFVALSVKAVHLELVSDLTTDAFLAAVRRFVAHRKKPSLLWSDHGTNFIGASREIKELITLLQEKRNQGLISDFCSSQGIVWKFTLNGHLYWRSLGGKV